jgi:hypothetical protein
MWQKLIIDYKNMEDEIDIHQKEAAALLRLLEAMFK